FAVFNALRGIVLTEEGFRFVFDPIALRRSSLSNQARGGLSYEVNPKSSVSFGASYDRRDYEDDPRFAGRLSDQNRIAGDVGYTHKIGEHGSWKSRYSFVRNQFKDLADANTHNVVIGYSHQLGPKLLVSVEGGPSVTEVPQLSRNVKSYNA